MTEGDGARPDDGRTDVIERRITLPPTAESARQARRLLRETLRAASKEQWLDDAELALSEVVTNAALHAHTEIEVHVEVTRASLCIEVRDYNEILPVERNYGDEAVTGRGMHLVAAVSSDCGVHSLGEAGKVIWFRIGGDDGERSADDILAAWDLDAWDDEGAGHTPTREVVLASMPATLWLAAREHHDAIIRELGYYLAQHPDVEIDIPSADKARSTISSTLVTALTDAQSTGTARPALPKGVPGSLPSVPQQLDLRLNVVDDGGTMFAVLQDVLDAAELLAVEGKLLVRPALPEIVAVRDWACEQVMSQLAGVPPTPWPGTAQERFETEVRGESTSGSRDWDPEPVLTSDRAVVAADDANRIVAVSRPAAELLGWDRDELVGRRIVTIVPPSLREAHVAGFTRHLSTGETHVLGVPIEVPVFTADGLEIPCRLLIERAGAGANRTVYTAWIEPLGEQRAR